MINRRGKQEDGKELFIFWHSATQQDEVVGNLENKASEFFKVGAT